jgi:hypothetical protein
MLVLRIIHATVLNVQASEEGETQTTARGTGEARDNVRQA